jgi:hypothetical protein
VIAPLVGWLVGSYLGRKVGRAYGEQRADELAVQIAQQLAAPPKLWESSKSGGHTFTCHPDGTVER